MNEVIVNVILILMLNKDKLFSIERYCILNYLKNFMIKNNLNGGYIMNACVIKFTNLDLEQDDILNICIYLKKYKIVTEKQHFVSLIEYAKINKINSILSYFKENTFHPCLDKLNKRIEYNGKISHGEYSKVISTYYI